MTAIDSPRKPAPTPTGQTVVTARSVKLIRKISSGGTVIGLFVMIAVFISMRPEVFLTFSNLRNILDQVAILGVVAVAQTLVMVVGEFDLSVGATASLSGIVTAGALLTGTPTPLAIMMGLLIGALIGIVNGILVAYLRLSAFVATLATMTSVSGIAFVVTNGSTLFGLPRDFSVLGKLAIAGIPLTAILMLCVAGAAWLVLARTTLGRRWHAIGGNAEVAKLSGINVSRARVIAFGLAGTISALGGILLASRLDSATSTSGDSTMLISVTAAFIGVTLSREGQANILGTLVGVALLGVLSSGLNIIGVNSYVQMILTGVIIIAAVALSRLNWKKH
jgi:ribose transport system permease protein